MLRQLDVRRTLLHLSSYPVSAGERDESLGLGRTGRPFSQKAICQTHPARERTDVIRKFYSDPSSNEKIWALGVQPAGEFVKYDSVSKRFLSLLPGVSGTDLDFSQDGKWVAYVAVPEGTLWRSRADGSDRLRLSDPPLQAALPHWSPDGKQIVYMSVESGKTWKILVVPTSGGSPQQLIGEDRNQVDPGWSPDGKQIVFGEEWSANNPVIQILDLNTHQISTIPGSERLFSPRWSPDGRYIAALSVDFTN